MTATKECRECKEYKPVTAEYFYKNKSYVGGYDTRCKECTREYNNNYQKGYRARMAEEPEALPLAGRSKKKILSKYQVGQTVNIKYRNRKEGSNEIEEKKSKIKILGFYSNLVLCLKDNFKECYNYREMDQMLAKGDK